MTTRPPNVAGARATIPTEPLNNEPVVLEYRLTRDPRSRAVLERFSEAFLRKHGRLRALVLHQIRRGIDPARADVAAALCEPVPRAEDEYTVSLSDEDRTALAAESAARGWRSAYSAARSKTATEADKRAARAAMDAEREWLRARITPERRAAAIAQRQAEIETETRVLCVCAAHLVKGMPKRPGRRVGTARTLVHEQEIATAYYHAIDRNAAGLDRMAAGTRTTKTAIKDDIARRYHIRRRTLETLLRAHPRAPRKN